MSQPAFQRVERSTGFSRLDFRAKLAVFALGTILAALWDDPRLGFGLMLAVLAGCFAVGISRRYLAFMLRTMTPFFILMLLMHGFFNVQYVLHLTGQTQLTPLLTLPENWWIIGGKVLSREGLFYGLNVLCKSATFLLLVPLCVFTTDPNNLVVGLVRLRVPYKPAFVISSTLRFFPLIFGEIQSVMETQRLRGFALEKMGLIDRVRIYSRVAVPVILGALFKAQQIDVVLQSKAFSGSPRRTYLHDSVLRPADWAVIATACIGLAAALWLRGAWSIGRFTVA